jgi:hypothetical protein
MRDRIGQIYLVHTLPQPRVNRSRIELRIPDANTEPLPAKDQAPRAAEARAAEDGTETADAEDPDGEASETTRSVGA